MFFFNQNLAEDYKSETQKIRVMSESWLQQYGYCVRCGKKLKHFKNNKPVADLYCENCLEEYELKSSKNKLGKKILGSAYSVMIEKIDNNTVPNFFHLNYNKANYSINDLIVIPKHCMCKSIITARDPLPETARRAGWIGCHIDISSIPKSGKIYLIQNGISIDKSKVIKQFKKTLFLKNMKDEPKGWLLDIIKCIELLDKSQFTLDEIYTCENILKIKHPDNHNIRAKIRQELQILRDYEYLYFSNRGEYSLDKY